MGIGDIALGHFLDFKSSDTVLLACSKPGLEQLRGVLSTPPTTPVAIHGIARVAPNYPVELFAAASASGAQRFTWLVDREHVQDIRKSLAELATSSSGHSYFDLVDSDTQLMVSLNEYDDKWWSAHA